VDKAWLVKCGENAESLGVLDISVELGDAKNSSGHLTRVDVSVSLKPNRGYALDSKVAAVVQRHQQTIDLKAAGLDLERVVLRVVGAQVLQTYTNLVRSVGCVFPTLVADSIHAHHATAADFAVINGGFVRASREYVPVGEGKERSANLTVRHIKEELPFDRETCCVRMLGRDLLIALEFMLRQTPTPDGIFPHPCSCVRVAFDPSREPLARIVSCKIKGRVLDLTAMYTVAVTTFIAGGGDGNTAWMRSDTIDDGRTSCFVRDQVLAFLNGVGDMSNVGANSNCLGPFVLDTDVFEPSVHVVPASRTSL
jgi:2',3'-cyclic-nucleotide 2'-phosphodiesterase (5'-nucleotidase family)